MCTISACCVRTAAHVICGTVIAVAGAACDEPAAGEAWTASDAAIVADASDAAPPDAAPPDAALPPSADAAAPLDAAVLPPAVPRESVDANGVRGALVDMPFLADMGDGKSGLVLVDWELPPREEFYLCGRITVPEDVYFNEIHPLNPLGTHHTAVGILDNPNRPDGVTLCDLSELGRRSIDQSGIGTAGGRMPSGIAMKAERGTQLLLNLHVFNPTDAPLRGRSGTLVVSVAPAQVTTLADSLAAGPLRLEIPPGRSVQTGVCTVEYDFQIFSVFPHMHQMGRHMKVVAERAGREPVVLHDGAFDFTHQVSHRIEPPLAMAAGDRIQIACTYENETGEQVHFGESSDDEMCLAQLARFPSGGRSACPF